MKQVRRHRKKVNQLPTTFADAASLQIPDELKVDGTGRIFLQADITTKENKRILIFATDTLLEGADSAEVSIAFADGTFRSCPPQFMQIWIVRVQIDGTNLPVLYALLENKTTLSYQTVLEFLHTKCTHFNPVTFVLDFESAEHNAALKTFPNCRIQGCLFHFGQCQRKHIRNFPGIEEDEILSMILCCIYGLPFVPLADVHDAFNEIRDRLLTLYPMPVSEKYIRYFENTWLNGPRHTSPECWNVNAAVEYGDPRTNNASEGGNNALNNATCATKPTIWALIKTLRKVNAKKETLFLQIQQKCHISNRKKKWEQRDAKIRNMVENYNPAEKFKFMKSIGYNFC